MSVGGVLEVTQCSVEGVMVGFISAAAGVNSLFSTIGDALVCEVYERAGHREDVEAWI